MFWIRIQMWSESDLQNGKFLRVDNFPRRSSKNHIDPSKSGWAPHSRGFRIRRDAVTACESLTREDEPLLLWGDTFLLFNTLLDPLNLKKEEQGCRSGPFLTGSRADLQEIWKPDPDPTVLKIKMQCCGSGVIWSGSSFEFSEFQVPDPCGSGSNLLYIKYISK